MLGLPSCPRPLLPARAPAALQEARSAHKACMPKAGQAAVSSRRQRRWFRPGHGFWTAEMVAVARQAGYSTVLGSIWPYDTFIQLPLLNAVHIWLKVYTGAVIVLHDRWVARLPPCGLQHAGAALRPAGAAPAQRLLGRSCLTCGVAGWQCAGGARTTTRTSLLHEAWPCGRATERKLPCPASTYRRRHTAATLSWLLPWLEWSGYRVCTLSEAAHLAAVSGGSLTTEVLAEHNMAQSLGVGSCSGSSEAGILALEAMQERMHMVRGCLREGWGACASAGPLRPAGRGGPTPPGCWDRWRRATRLPASQIKLWVRLGPGLGVCAAGARSLC